MAGRIWKNFLRLFIVLPFLFMGLVAGCGTPRERYQVLSYFFDGVPDPDAAKQKIAEDNAGTNRVLTAAIISRHKPYVEAGSDTAKCDEYCHGRAGIVLDFDQAYQSCVKCHAKVSTSKEKMHGPVATAACKYCHAPHESTQEYLLKDDPVKVCTQCHQPNLLGDKPAEHRDGTTSCLNCHFGHGGHDSYFLKPTAPAPAPKLELDDKPPPTPPTRATGAAKGGNTS